METKGPWPRLVKLAAMQQTMRSCHRASRIGARRAVQPISGSTRKTSDGTVVGTKAATVMARARDQRMLRSARPPNPGCRNSSMNSPSRISCEVRWMMKTATATATGPSEVGDRGGQPEDERPDERTDQARRREADQVPVVAEAPASPPTGQHLVDHQALRRDPDGVPDRHVPGISTQGQGGQDHGTQQQRQGNEPLCVRARVDQDPRTQTHRPQAGVVRSVRGAGRRGTPQHSEECHQCRHARAARLQQRSP